MAGKQHLEPEAFKSILRSITKPFRQKPTIDINTKDDGVFWVVTLTLKWFVADLNIKIQFDSTNRDAFISVRLNGRTLVEREI
jgi:hypothetical protein